LKNIKLYFFIKKRKSLFKEKQFLKNKVKSNEKRDMIL